MQLQDNPPWGLDRIDQRNLPLNRTYTYNWIAVAGLPPPRIITRGLYPSAGDNGSNTDAPYRSAAGVQGVGDDTRPGVRRRIKCSRSPPDPVLISLPFGNRCWRGYSGGVQPAGYS